MKISVEISMYPFRPDYEEAILGFIALLQANERLRVEVNTMSTQIFGEYDHLMPTLQTAIKQAFTAEQVTVMVMKVLYVHGQG